MFKSGSKNNDFNFIFIQLKNVMMHPYIYVTVKINSVKRSRSQNMQFIKYISTKHKLLLCDYTLGELFLFVLFFIFGARCYYYSLVSCHSKQQPAGPENTKAFSQLLQSVGVQEYHISNPCRTEMKSDQTGV